MSDDKPVRLVNDEDRKPQLVTVDMNDLRFALEDWRRAGDTVGEWWTRSNLDVFNRLFGATIPMRDAGDEDAFRC